MANLLAGWRSILGAEVSKAQLGELTLQVRLGRARLRRSRVEKGRGGAVQVGY